MCLRYKSKFALDDEHRDAISAIVFSPDGRSLASSSDDGKVVIWSLLSGRLDNGRCCEGTLTMFTLDETMVTASGFLAHHEGPVELLSGPDIMDINSCSDHLLASAAGNTVKIWNWSHEAKFWRYYHTIDYPQNVSYSTFTVEVTGVQWLAYPQDDCLAVSYLHHGIICWKIHNDIFSVLWAIHMPLWISSGLREMTIRGSDEQPDRILPVTFHHGQLLLAGSMTGKVHLYSSEDGKRLQTVKFKGSVPVQTVSV
ncbi:WD40 repeat-like protein [Laetiporus sulphureus 93-53]|uniref:WD40 repeat-like protein n=1 Tax=Laetiporus sulphureus 93-53 TaxID=1314785 RepID=A0A165D3E1_9APHY|nr:WD40 repeat-like protein [Laetiporus sulphureus 93-53]KZT04081.1 WD40 repeat-like protein [Laetiporus sulphureus 93-53]